MKPAMAKRCLNCGGKVYLDDGEPKCLMCGGDPRMKRTLPKPGSRTISDVTDSPPAKRIGYRRGRPKKEGGNTDE